MGKVAKALRLLLGKRNETEGSPEQRTRDTLPLSPKEHEDCVAMMDRGVFDFDDTLTAKLKAQYEITRNYNQCPFPSGFLARIDADPILINRKVMLELFYRLPYTEVYEKSQLPYYKNIIDKIVSCGVPLNEAMIIDIGCGFGGLLSAIHNESPSSRLYGIECVPSPIKYIAHHRDFIHTAQHDIESHAPVPHQLNGHFFDLVIMVDLLEHLMHPENALRNAYSLIKTGGCVVVAVPDGRADSTPQHINFWSAESWKVFLRNTFGDADIQVGIVESEHAAGGKDNFALIR